MTGLGFEDKRYLEAAEGWLGLGDWQAANEELDQISFETRSQPEVLEIRWQVYAYAQKWDLALQIASDLCAKVPDSPDAHVHLALTLGKLQRTEKARDLLL